MPGDTIIVVAGWIGGAAFTVATICIGMLLDRHVISKGAR
jgi:hypothetical protein